MPSAYQWFSAADSKQAWRADYTPYGQVNTVSASVVEPLNRHIGQWRLTNSGTQIWTGSEVKTLRSSVFLNRYRLLDPRTGQYLSADPPLTRYVAGWSTSRHAHPYSYAESSPPNYTDPDGRHKKPGVYCRFERGLNRKCQRECVDRCGKDPCEWEKERCINNATNDACLHHRIHACYRMYYECKGSMKREARLTTICASRCTAKCTMIQRYCTVTVPL